MQDRNGFTVAKVEQIVSLLSEASCLENDDATFMLSTLYDSGLGVRMNQTLVSVFVMSCR